ncbi:MFS transporter [Candidatus Bathyarchaeota archaeon]|nr:MFS transporter [Candidatus Bathyarchaeota archaeon]
MSFLQLIRETFSNRNIVVVTLSQTLFMFTAFLWWPYRSLYILELGGTKEQLGLLLMLETISGIVFQLPGGILADRLGRKKLLVVSSGIRMLSPLVFLYSASWVHTAPGFILTSAGMLGGPALNALVAESIPPESRGSGIAIYRTVTSIPMIVTSLLGGVIVDYFGVIRGCRYVLLASAVVSLLSIAMNWLYIEETLEPAGDGRGQEGPRKGVIQELGSMPRDVWILTGVAAISAFAMRLIMSFMVVYGIEVVGLTATQWGIIGTGASMLTTLLTTPSGMMGDRVGRKPLIVASRVLASFSVIGYTFSHGFWHIAAVRGLWAAGSGLGGTMWGPMGGPVWQALVVDLTPPEERARMMGLMGTLISLASTPSSWAGGYMYDNVSPQLPFQVGFVIDMVGTALFIALFKERRRSGTDKT